MPPRRRYGSRPARGRSRCRPCSIGAMSAGWELVEAAVIASRLQGIQDSGVEPPAVACQPSTARASRVRVSGETATGSPAVRLRVPSSLSGRKRLQRASSSTSRRRAAASAALRVPTVSSSTWVPMAGIRQVATWRLVSPGWPWRRWAVQLFWDWLRSWSCGSAGAGAGVGSPGCLPGGRPPGGRVGPGVADHHRDPGRRDAGGRQAQPGLGAQGRPRCRAGWC